VGPTVQLSRHESTAVLQQLYAHVRKHLAFQARVHWEPGTLLFWDNWATQHHAVWDYFPEERWGERVSVCLEQGPRA
jgi:taurine dioxygenase